MRLINQILLLGLFLALPVGTWSRPNAVTDTTYYTLAIPKGQKKSAFPINTRATAAVWNDSTALYVRIQVHDTDLVLNNDPIHSDHVELWIALPNDEINDNQYILSDGDSTLWLCDGKADTAAFNKELRHPELGEYDLDPTQMYTDSSSVLWHLDQELEEIHKHQFKKITIPFGQTHYGFLPGKKKVHLYDQEFANLIWLKVKQNWCDDDLPTNFIAEGNSLQQSLIQNVSCTVDRTHDGYISVARIPSASLLYFGAQGSANLRILLDVVDAHANGSAETILSSSRKRHWGDSNTYNSLNLSVPLKDSSLFSIIPSDSQRTDSRVFLHTREGWACITKAVKEFAHQEYNAGSPYDEFTLPHLSTASFYHRESGMRKDTVNGEIITTYIHIDDSELSGTGRRDLVYFQNGSRVTAPQCVKVFALPDSSIAFLVAELSQDGLDADDELFLCRLDSSDTITDLGQTDWYHRTRLVLGSLRYDHYHFASDLDGYGYPDHSHCYTGQGWTAFNDYWEHLIHWVKPGKSFKLDFCQDLEVLIEWSDDGKTVHATKIE